MTETNKLPTVVTVLLLLAAITIGFHAAALYNLLRVGFVAIPQAVASVWSFLLTLI